jgi:hypothetical protein
MSFDEPTDAMVVSRNSVRLIIDAGATVTFEAVPQEEYDQLITHLAILKGNSMHEDGFTLVIGAATCHLTPGVLNSRVQI